MKRFRKWSDELNWKLWEKKIRERKKMQWFDTKTRLKQKSERLTEWNVNKDKYLKKNPILIGSYFVRRPWPDGESFLCHPRKSTVVKGPEEKKGLFSSSPPTHTSNSQSDFREFRMSIRFPTSALNLTYFVCGISSLQALLSHVAHESCKITRRPNSLLEEKKNKRTSKTMSSLEDSFYWNLRLTGVWGCSWF